MITAKDKLGRAALVPIVIPLPNAGDWYNEWARSEDKVKALSALILAIDAETLAVRKELHAEREAHRREKAAHERTWDLLKQRADGLRLHKAENAELAKQLDLRTAERAALAKELEQELAAHTRTSNALSMLEAEIARLKEPSPFASEDGTVNVDEPDLATHLHRAWMGNGYVQIGFWMDYGEGSLVPGEWYRVDGPTIDDVTHWMPLPPPPPPEEKS